MHRLQKSRSGGRRYCVVAVRTLWPPCVRPVSSRSVPPRLPTRAFGRRRDRSPITSLSVSFLRRLPWFAVPLAIFALTRAADAVMILVIARDQIPAAALSGDLPLPTLVDPHSYFHVIANWDGQWYRLIAGHGYPSTLPTRDGVVQQNAWAFYPVF